MVPSGSSKAIRRRLDESVLANTTKRAGINPDGSKFFVMDGFLCSRSGSNTKNDSSVHFKASSVENRLASFKPGIKTKSPKESDIMMYVANDSGYAGTYRRLLLADNGRRRGMQFKMPQKNVSKPKLSKNMTHSALLKPNKSCVETKKPKKKVRYQHGDSSIKDIIVKQFAKHRDMSIDSKHCNADGQKHPKTDSVNVSNLVDSKQEKGKGHFSSMEMPVKNKQQACIAERLNLPMFLPQKKGFKEEGYDKLTMTQQTTLTLNPKQQCPDDSEIAKGITERLADLFNRIEQEEGEPEEVTKLRAEIASSFKAGSEGPKTTLYYYKILKMLGKGSFGKVYMASQVLTNRVVAIKCLDKKAVKEDNRKNKILHELLMFKTLSDHPNVTQIYEVFENKKYFFFVMEYASGGDLLQLMKRKNRLTEHTARGIFIQLVRGLKYIHSKGILHRDIKLDNILLIEADGELKAKICDFGVSRFVKDHEVINEQCGTPAYIAPEIIRKKGYKGFTVDIWSLGVLLYAMVMGAMPFKASNIDGLHDKILNRDCEMEDPEVSQEALDLIEKMLTINPDKRITLDEIIEHNWLKNDPRMGLLLKQTKELVKEPDQFILQKIQRCGFPGSFIQNSLADYSLNHAFACYMTLAKDFE